eukprot:779512-Heterocapsa_arctica.AAC.1
MAGRSFLQDRELWVGNPRGLLPHRALPQERSFGCQIAAPRYACLRWALPQSPYVGRFFPH